MRCIKVIIFINTIFLYAFSNIALSSASCNQGEDWYWSESAGRCVTPIYDFCVNNRNLHDLVQSEKFAAIRLVPGTCLDIFNFFARATHIKVNSRYIDDLNIFRGLSHVEVLELGNTGVTDFSSLKEIFPNLKAIDIHSYRHLNGEFNKIDISPLSDLQTLQRVSLCNMQVYDYSPLANLKKLSVLTIENNDFKDLSILEELPLFFLNITDTSVTNLKPLEKITSLRIFYGTSTLKISEAPTSFPTELKIMH